jgi:hypothetical protein
MNKLPHLVRLTFFVRNIAGNLAGPQLHQTTASKSAVFIGARQYRASEIRRWVRGDWLAEEGKL